MTKYIAFLRGINVGGHTVKKEQFLEIFSKLDLKKIKTVIASGNIIFESEETNEKRLTEKIEQGLEKALGYKVTTMLRTNKEIEELIKLDPFKKIKVTKQTRLYVAFVQDKIINTLPLPYFSEDGNFQILSKIDREVFSVLILTEDGQSLKLMTLIEKEYGKQSTTRNWNTVEKISAILVA